MSKREMAASILSRRLTQQVWFCLSKIPGLRILAYHRVLDENPSSFPFDEALISTTSEMFYRQMQFVRRHFQVTSFRELAERDRTNRPWPERAVIITFDDGYRDNYTNAWPILKDLGMTATLFLVTGHVGGAELFWWDAVAYCVKHTRRRTVTLSVMSPEPIALASDDERRRAKTRILEWLKKVPEEIRHHFVAQLGVELEVALPDGLGEGMHLSWEEARQMAAAGIEFGSHSVTHSILTQVSEAQLKAEAIVSKRTIEQQLGQKVLAFAYPAGRRHRFSRAVRAMIVGSGYRYGLSYDEGLVMQAHSDQYALPRIHVERDFSWNLFRANLLFPQWMFRGNQIRSAPRPQADPYSLPTGMS